MTKKLVTWSAVVALVLTAGWYALLRPNPVLRISADFVAADGIFPGNRVAILGVPVGTVESVQPRGAFVRVTMTMPPETEIPADAHAYITSPAVISDRYVEIGPAYQGGEKLTDGAVIPLERSHAPIRWDQLTKSLQTLLDALGPQQADEDLGKLLHTTGTVLDGKGPQIRSAIASLTQASDLVVRNKDDITAVLDNIDQLLRILEENQRTVEELTTASEQAAAELHGQRQELGEVIDSLSSALVEVNDLVNEHGAELTGDVQQLVQVSNAVLARQHELTETLDVLPLALDNVSRTITEDERMRLRLDISTNLDQFSTTAKICAAFPLPLCNGAGLVNPIPFPPELPDPLGMNAESGGGR
ncbi:MCE family protein [Saccharopolyspora rectivirgula]|jgi:phospholipid/cholesterol/gamma-HCH transport system substrate-binding protein|uniref:Mammalian cell entry protein n=1 Tax=Saccharopolyspora rectivirgula TaxID=28042 RepID=A0A073B2L2_9PSEU|nr:MCE family protein [Saccharopolyspora rectivirgula]KEI45796.1 mammalian cell entry protein [Saccharopolyspora rectivirgula]